MVGTQWSCISTTSDLDQGVVINRHRDGLAYSRMRPQDGIVEVEVHRFEEGGIGIGVGHIGRRQFLIRQELRDIQEVG